MSSLEEKFEGGAKTEGVRGPGDFARRLLAEWRRRGWPTSGERVVVAVSGGADSTALLLALEELKRIGLHGLELTAAHLDHGLRGESAEEDARFAEALARAHGFEFVSARVDVYGRASESGDNLEQAARRARYEFLSEAAKSACAAAVLTGHTLDDQAETVLLRLLRGSGSEGLGGMRPERSLEEGGKVVLRRPLLEWARRAETEGYCRVRGVEFRSDEMNEDERFARVRVRRTLLPLLETFNPRAAESIARAAGLLREEAAALEGFAARLLEEARGEAFDASDSGAWPLRVGVLSDAPMALRRRALRLWIARGRGDLRRVNLAHISAVERLLAGERGGRVAELPGGARVERRRGLLRFYSNKG